MKEVHVLSIGVINIQTGKTQYDWSVYEQKEARLFLCSGGFFLYGVKDSLNIGDKLILRNNDSNRKIKETTVIAIMPTNKDAIIKELLDYNYDYRQLRAFSKKRFKNKLNTSYSIKGVILV